MAIFVDESTRLVVQGLTGSEGRFHGLRNRAYGTKVVAGLVSHDGRVLDREDRLTPRRTAPAVEVEAIIADAVDALRRRHDVSSVGVAAAGFVDPDGERVRFAPHLSWRDEPLRRRLGDRIGLPVRVANDANAALWGEKLYGAARPHLIAVTGYGQEGDRQRSAAAGFHLHMVKPVDLGTLKQVVLEGPGRPH